jgi:hypothetical protein
MLENIIHLLMNSNVVLPLLVCFIFYLIETRTKVLSHWHHTFDNINFSSQEFYTTLRTAIMQRKIPGINILRVTHSERLILSPKREYLRINWKGETFDICAAPYGEGMYVSWWFVETTTRFHRFLRRVPIINWLYTTKTYHRVDLEQMFEDLVHHCVLESIDVMTGVTGSMLSESDRAIIRLPGKFQ